MKINSWERDSSYEGCDALFRPPHNASVHTQTGKGNGMKYKQHNRQRNWRKGQGSRSITEYSV